MIVGYVFNVGNNTRVSEIRGREDVEKIETG
jgi:hypothetical protein